MKYAFLVVALALLTSCNPNPKKNETLSVKIDTTSVDLFSMDSLDSALLSPEKVVNLKLVASSIDSKLYLSKHLPAEIGTFTNLKTLEMHCLEKLEDLPVEIGKLKNLERIDINNGNGCSMNISIPSSIDQLQNLKTLILYGAIDPRTPEDSIGNVKNLPEEFANLKNLETLDLGRNGLDSVPHQVAGFSKLKTLRLDYNRLEKVPSFISKLTNLQFLEISGNGKIELPNSLSELKNLTVHMGGSYLSLKDQRELRTRFPKITFDFRSEYLGIDANETEEKK